MRKFEVISKYLNDNIELPIRSTQKSAGYDLKAAEDIIIPSYPKIIYQRMADIFQQGIGELNYQEMLIKQFGIKPILVPTGLKIQLNDYDELELRSRSSIATKNLIMLANSVGTIDADYYNNEDNEGHIMVPMINLSPFDVIIKKGDKIAQALIKNYYTIDDEKTNQIARNGGFGSTDKESDN